MQPQQKKTTKQQQQFTKQIQKALKNHPDHRPVYFVKHPDAVKDLKQPTSSLILFEKKQKIDQPMKSLMNQLNQKGIYFFTIDYKATPKIRIVYLKPGPTIQEVYQKYGCTDGLLTILYTNQQLGMKSIKSMEKWMNRIIIFLALVWLSLFLYPYFRGYNKPQDL